MHRAVEINIIVIVALAIFSEVIYPTHRDASINKVGTLEK
jgi:hypothetical protein